VVEEDFFGVTNAIDCLEVKRVFDLIF